MIRRAAVLFLSLAVCLAWVDAAVAADDPTVSDEAALLDQYVEQVPSSAGTHGGSGGGGGSGSGLPDPVQNQLVQAVGQDNAATLEEVATSSGFGAPQTELKTAQGSSAGRAASDPGLPEVSGGSVFSNAASLLEDGGGGSHLTALAVLLGLVTGSAILAAALRRRPAAEAVPQDLIKPR